MNRAHVSRISDIVGCEANAPCGEQMAASIGIPYNIAIVDSGDHLVAFIRQDGSLIGSIDLAD